MLPERLVDGHGLLLGQRHDVGKVVQFRQRQFLAHGSQDVPRRAAVHARLREAFCQSVEDPLPASDAGGVLQGLAGA